jgi:transposase
MKEENTATKTHHLIALHDYAALIGIDWADQKHALATLVAPFEAGAAPEPSELEQKTAALIDWIRSLQERFGPAARIAVVLEQRKGALIHFLSAFDFIDLFPVEPLSLKSFRKALHPSGAKSDPVDAALLVEFFLHHHRHLRCWHPQSASVRQGAQYCEDRRSFVDQRARALQRLKASLKLYFPLALELFDDLATPLCCAFLARWTTLDSLQRARPATLRAFFHRHGSRSATLITRRLELITAARPLTSDKGIIEPLVLRVSTLVAQITTLNRMITRYDEHIAQLLPTLDQDGIFQSFPGAGVCLTPRLAVVFGLERERFASAAELQMLTGAAPVTQQSGKKKLVTMRWACSTFQRQTLVEFALSSLRFSAWARAFFASHLPADPDADKPTYSVLRKLAFKWLRIMFRCWKMRTPYDEAKYLESLRRANSPLWHKLQEQEIAAAA